MNLGMKSIITSEMQKGEFATVYCGELNSNPLDKVAIKVYYLYDCPKAKRERAVFTKMTEDEDNPHSFFIMKLRECEHEIPSNMMFMDLYPVTLTEWSSIVAVPLDVLKLQLHMVVQSIEFCH